MKQQTNVWTKKYDAFHLSNISKYKNLIKLDYYVYNKLIDIFATEHSITPTDISFSKDRLIYKDETIGACGLTKTGYKYLLTIEVTDSFKAEYYGYEK